MKQPFQYYFKILMNKGNYGVAAALATMLTVFTIIALIVFNMIGSKKDL